jgi:3D (Asp-Asp-Asp) domain-containing protein
MTPATVMLAALLAFSTSTTKPHAAKPRKPARYTVTAYCTKGTTDAGTHTKRGIVAADPRLLPFGSVVRVDGLAPRPQTFVVTDSGSAVKGRHLDVFMPSCAAARKFGKRVATARVVGHVDLDTAESR